ncbi:LLM class flavin-dependent oxidoreductase [Vineibacter terrae]|uniref:LLM class flavin-dependent oxidoreductase n=1 Tax=Vineibacter terrae TaxID=2586908 RepID=A0A5C8PEU3_9HYPH|nr:LLM class flavin-dependent oxidoreductase [Vineibacter terrae]TXL72126.1 LLM class flavin-dependent oxidoreductase [Vineibacter terrae]
MPRLGYLLPTREQIMVGRHETAPLLALAERAEALGFDSVWVGDSLLARPRHDPLTLLAAVTARTRSVALGTAVLLPALRNPVVLAQQVATLDRLAEGRLILGVGIATDVPNIRAEFEAAGVPFDKRVGRLVEGLALARALWSGQKVDWDGRWTVKAGVLGPTPHRPGGPPVWIGGSVAAARARAGRLYDGWFPNAPTAAAYDGQWQEVQAAARAAGRDPAALTGAMYLTLAIDEDGARAEATINTFLEQYYGMRPDTMRKRQMCYAGPAAGAADWLKAYADAGASHLVLRFAGDPERQLETVARLRRDLGW